MSWDAVETGLAGSEETARFGPRVESGSALYQVDTLACLAPRNQVSVDKSVDFPPILMNLR